MANNELIITLAIATLLLVVVYAVWQRFRVGKAKDEHEHSAMTAGHPEARAETGAPGVKPRR